MLYNEKRDTNAISRERRLRSCFVKDDRRKAYFSMFPVEFSDDESPVKHEILSLSDCTEEEIKSCWWTTADYASFDANRLEPSKEECTSNDKVVER